MIDTQVYELNYQVELTRRWAVAPDGRFLILRPVEVLEASDSPPQIVLAQNWLEELKAMMPVQ